MYGSMLHTDVMPAKAEGDALHLVLQPVNTVVRLSSNQSPTSVMSTRAGPLPVFAKKALTSGSVTWLLTTGPGKTIGVLLSSVKSVPLTVFSSPHNGSIIVSPSTCPPPGLMIN